ncbi:MAG: lipid-binding SYLF domain-containing protein [Pseudomonadota bacterium]|nr:lipid-binding SYLF domain-containing protein [Pseudomonadota bacterium]
MLRRTLGGALLAIAAAVFAAAPAQAENKREKAEELVAKAAETTSYFTQDSAFETMWSLADDAKAMVIIPNSWRGGFMFGGSGGNAVMIARNDDGSWSQPTFFTVGSFSFGFQAGLENSEIVLLVMTQRGMEHLLSTTVKLGGDVSIAAGPIGAGAKAQTTDVLAFSRSRGLYGGVSLEGAILKARHSWNEAYYGAKVSPSDIIYRERAYNPSSASLQNAVMALAARDGGRATTLAPAQARPYGAPAAQPAQKQYEDDEVWGAPVKNDPNH